MGNRDNNADKRDGRVRQGTKDQHRHLDWRRKLVIGLIVAIALGVVMAVNAPIKETVEILAEKVDIGGRFYVSPGKLRINLKDEPVTVSVYAKNKSEGADVYSIQLMTPIGYEPGYKEWDGSYTIEFRESVRIGADRLARFDVTLTRLESGGKQEIWLVVGESEVDWVIQELAVRILVDG